MFLAFEERLDESIDMAKRSVAIDPLSPLINMNAGWTYFTAGLMEEAREQAAKMIEIEPEFYGAYWINGAIYLTEGKYEEAIGELKKGVELGGHQTLLADLGSAYGLAGRKEEAERVLNELLELRERDYVSARPSSIASAFDVAARIGGITSSEETKPKNQRNPHDDVIAA